MASCADNVTAGRGGPARVVTSYVCQAILVPPDVTGARAAVSSQPISLGDHLLGEWRGGALRHLRVTETHGRDRHWNTLVAWAHQHKEIPVGLGHVWDEDCGTLVALRVGHLVETGTP